jgi:hypothetical protein
MGIIFPVITGVLSLLEAISIPSATGICFSYIIIYFLGKKVTIEKGRFYDRHCFDYPAGADTDYYRLPLPPHGP